MGHRHAPKAAKRLADFMVTMRIEIRKRAYTRDGRVEEQKWDEVYRLMREYEDAEVRDMLNGTREKEQVSKKRRKRDKVRKKIREATDNVVVEKKRTRKPSEKHPWRATGKRKNLTNT